MTGTLRSVIDHRTFSVVAANAAKRTYVDALVSDARLSDDAIVVFDASKLTAFVAGVAGRSGRAGTDGLKFEK